TFDVVSVNDAPTGTNNTLTALEDTPLNFIAADFGLNDASDAPANDFAGIIITTLPANGTLELSGVAVTAGQTITAAQLGNLTFTANTHESGNAYASFGFRVID